MSDTLAKLTRAAAAAALAAAALPAAGRAQPRARGAAPAAPAPPPAAGAPLRDGSYAAVVPATDTRAARAEGSWELTLSGAGATRAYAVTNLGQQIGTGTFAVEGAVAPVTHDSEACRGNESGRYAWTTRADTLRLVATADGCEARLSVLASHLWVRRR